jgi:cardiolipin synthase
MFTIPNFLTLLRALGIPVFLHFFFQESYPFAVVTLMIAGATDYFDGKLARLFNQESRLGELMDPAVDRLYIATILLAMYLTDSVPVSLLIVIVLRDLILGLLLIKMKSAGIPPFKVTYLGKAATFNLLYALPLLLLTSTSLGLLADVAFITGWAFAGWGIALYIYTGFAYGISGVKLLRRRNEIEGK